MLKEVVLLFTLYNPEQQVQKEIVRSSYFSEELEEAWDLCNAARDYEAPLVFLPTNLWELECFEQRSNWPRVDPSKQLPKRKPPFK